MKISGGSSKIPFAILNPDSNLNSVAASLIQNNGYKTPGDDPRAVGSEHVLEGSSVSVPVGLGLFVDPPAGMT